MIVRNIGMYDDSKENSDLISLKIQYVLEKTIQ